MTPPGRPSRTAVQPPGDTADRIRIEVPGAPSSLAVIRAVVGGAAATADLTFDELADVEVAADEAAASLIRHGAKTIGVTVGLRAGRLDIEVHGDGPEEGWPSAELQSGLARRLLDGLTERLHIATSDSDGQVIAFRSRVTSS